MYSLLNKYPDDYDMAWISALKDINDPNGIRPCPIMYTGQKDDLIRVSWTLVNNVLLLSHITGM